MLFSITISPTPFKEHNFIIGKEGGTINLIVIRYNYKLGGSYEDKTSMIFYHWGSWRDDTHFWGLFWVGNWGYKQFYW